jgi:hypothetical protein
MPPEEWAQSLVNDLQREIFRHLNHAVRDHVGAFADALRLRASQLSPLHGREIIMEFVESFISEFPQLSLEYCREPYCPICERKFEEHGAVALTEEVNARICYGMPETEMIVSGPESVRKLSVLKVTDAEGLARRVYDAFNKLNPQFNSLSAQGPPWDETDDESKRFMIAVCQEVLHG